MHTKTLKQSRSSDSSPMMSAVYKRQWRLDDIVGVVGLVRKKVEVKEESQVMEVGDVTERTALLELGPQVVQKVRKVREAM